MCFDSLAWATKQELPAMQKIVLVMLADHNSKAGLCFPSYDTLAVECGMTKRSVITQVEKLESAGLLSIERFKNRANRYVLNIVTGESLSPQGESVSLQSERASPEPVINQSNNLKDISYSSDGEKSDEILTTEQQEVFDWAVVHAYWYTATVSIATFLKVYAHQGGVLKAQFNAHKKAQSAIKHTGLNSEIYMNKNTGGNYETRGKFNQHGSLSKHDQQTARFEQARERAMAEYRANNAIVIN